MQVYRWVRFAIGYVFITSGIVKLLVPSFQEVFANLGIPYANISLFLLAMIEIICGTLIIVNMYVKYVTVTLMIIMVGAIIIAKLPVLLQEGILSFLFESRLDVTMLILLVILWRKHDFEEKLQYTKWNLKRGLFYCEHDFPEFVIDIIKVVNEGKEVELLNKFFYIIYFIVLVYIVWMIRGETDPDVMINFVPFQTIRLYINAFIYGYAPTYIIIGNLVGNIILFLPLGLFIYTYAYQIGIVTLLFLSIYIPFYIEGVQFLLYIAGYGTRSIDIDDVLLNMFGILLGYTIGYIKMKKQRK